MPASWTTDKQLDFLKDELPGFHAAQRNQHGTQFLRGLAERWFERWPEREALFFNATDAPEMALTVDDDKRLTTAVARRIQVRVNLSENSPYSL